MKVNFLVNKKKRYFIKLYNSVLSVAKGLLKYHLYIEICTILPIITRTCFSGLQLNKVISFGYYKICFGSIGIVFKISIMVKFKVQMGKEMYLSS